MRRFVSWLALPILLAGCEAGTAPEGSSRAEAGTRVSATMQHVQGIERNTFTDVIEDPCTGQPLAISGKDQHVFNLETTDPTKGFLHVADTYTASATALAPDGTEYVSHVSEHFTLESPNFPTPETDVSFHRTFLFISTGSAPNFVELVVFHLIILPSGEFKTTMDFEGAECRG
jgi:hypothetical protein